MYLPSKRVRFVGVPDEDGLDRLARVERAGLERHESLEKIRLFNILRCPMKVKNDQHLLKLTV